MAAMSYEDFLPTAEELEEIAKRARKERQTGGLSKETKDMFRQVGYQISKDPDEIISKARLDAILRSLHSRIMDRDPSKKPQIRRFEFKKNEIFEIDPRTGQHKKVEG